jgi:hypothetical protein
MWELSPKALTNLKNWMKKMMNRSILLQKIHHLEVASEAEALVLEVEASEEQVQVQVSEEEALEEVVLAEDSVPQALLHSILVVPLRVQRQRRRQKRKNQKTAKRKIMIKRIP